MQNISASAIHQLATDSSPLFCAVVGPTAVGKTEISLALAERMGCEILCVDAVQVYRGLDIGAAKPTPEEQKRVVHHGLDLVSPMEHFNASRYAEAVEPILDTAAKRYRPLVLCGGTGLYYRALLEGFFFAPDPDPALRAQLERRAQVEGVEVLYAELRRNDPPTADAIHPRDARRIVRALEIMRQTGTTVSELRQTQKPKPWMKMTGFIGFTRDKVDMARRIEKRTRWMYHNGLVEETRRLLEIGCTDKHTALQGLGYKECMAHLRGRLSLEDAVSQTILATQRYAKRQMTWFRHQFPTRWLEIGSENNFSKIIDKSLQLWLNNGNNDGSIC